MKRILATAAVAAAVVAPTQLVLAGAASAAPADVASYPAIDLGSVEIPLDGSCSPEPCPTLLDVLLTGSSAGSAE
ncbi:hypothetical protein ACFXK0_18400 [Nocardia sp. NPDC059177]|uniref:hypothetical protein n=1 Tax=Nocardia sp. NPDC059177 TaxID=3346759 RepID=UPI00368FAD2B